MKSVSLPAAWRFPVFLLGVLLVLHALGPWVGDAAAWGVWPGSLEPWWGPWTFHLRHSSWGHLASNAVGVLGLGALAAATYPRAQWGMWAWLWILPGLGVWFIGRPGPHVGASALVYGLFHFIVAMAVLRRTRAGWASLFIASLMFGGLLFGMLAPEPGVSWEGHAAGALAGWIAALHLFRRDPWPPAWVWSEEPEDQNEDPPPPPSPPPNLNGPG